MANGDQQYDDEMRFVLFPNKDKQEGDKRPNLKGHVQMGGRKYPLSGWTRTSNRDGSKFISGVVEMPKDSTGAAPTQAAPVQAAPVVQPTPDEEIPF